MTKADLVTEIASQTGYDKKTILRILDKGMANIKKAVGADEDVSLRGFGTFSTKMRAQKTARNILRNTTVVVPAHKAIVFKPSPEFKLIVK